MGNLKNWKQKSNQSKQKFLSKKQKNFHFLKYKTIWKGKLTIQKFSEFHVSS